MPQLRIPLLLGSCSSSPAPFSSTNRFGYLLSGGPLSSCSGSPGEAYLEAWLPELYPCPAVEDKGLSAGRGAGQGSPVVFPLLHSTSS